MARFEKRDPKTKEAFVDRILSYDFDGDIRHLGQGDAKLERTGPQSFRITFQSGRTYELVVRIPRDADQPAVVRQGRSGEERSFAPAEGSEEHEVRQEVRPRGRATARAEQPAREEQQEEPVRPRRQYRRRQQATG